MKAIINKLTVIAITALIITGCKKEGDLVTAKSEATASTISASNSTIALSKEVVEETVVTFTWTKTDFGYEAGESYTLQFDKKGNNFASPKNVPAGRFATGAALKKAFNGLEFNNALLALNLPTGVASEIEVRVKSEVTTVGSVSKPAVSVTPVYSAPITLTVTPFALTAFIYVPGAYQDPAGVSWWNPATADSLVSETGNGIYEGIIPFATSALEFKILTKKSWGPPEYGVGAAEGTIAIGGGNLTAPGVGNYKLIANLNTNTLTFEPFSWGLVGSAPGNNWGNPDPVTNVVTPDVAMKYDNGKKLWSVTVNLQVGEFKFRKNSDWGTNFGDEGANGSLDAGGTNIAITTAGTYKVVLDLVNNTYTLTKL